MKIRTVKILSCLALSLACVVADAQKREIPEGYLPQAGDVSFGLTINPLTATRAVRIAAGEATGDKIVRVSDVAYQMQFMTQDPLAALSVKYKMNDKLSFRGMLGFSGVQVNYKEYVLDDRAVTLNPLSKAQVVDQITCRLNLGNVQAGVEYSLGERKLRFIMGANIVYAFGGGDLRFAYGNGISALNPAPTCSPLVDDKATFTLNKWVTDGDIAYARPTKRYNVGLQHAVGLKADMGIEWFFASRLALNAKMTFTPVMFAFQPQTYTTYEGYSAAKGSVVGEYNVLVSPGSNYVMYGTESLGLELGLHYYF